MGSMSAIQAGDYILGHHRGHRATFTISNLGPFGIERFTAIINPPQTAILAVGATRPEGLPDFDGRVVVRPILRLTLAVDHRAIDGVEAARFLATYQEIIEAMALRYR